MSEILTFDSISEQVLTLPPIVDRESIKKRYAGVPDFGLLKGQQIEAAQIMKRYLSEGLEGYDMVLLNGYAGTGKTFTIGKVIEDYFINNRGAKIAMTAPTNKAVTQLYKAAEFTHTNMVYKTIHSLLGLVEKITNHGKQIFIQDRRKPASIEEYDVLVVDEVSMLNDDLFQGSSDMDGIVKYAQMNGLKIIMMGDPAQIPPVNRLDCIPLSTTGQAKYRIKVIELTEPQRQTLDNPIFVTGMKIRNALHRPVSFPAADSELNENGKGVIFFRGGVQRDEELIEKMLDLYYPSGNFAEDADFMKTIAWRNKTVTYMNNVIREMVFGVQASKARIVVGEKLICNKPIFEGAYIIFNTNDEFMVLEHKVEVERINNGQFDINYYSTKVKFENPEGTDVEAYIKVVHESSQVTYDKILKMLVDSALSKKQGTWEAGKAWQDKFTFEQNFADVSYNYSITAHKSQGSTYDRTLVLAKDIDASNNVVERNRIKYTACTRPKNLLFVVV